MKGNRYELPRNIDRHLAALSKLYELEGERDLQELLVNAQVRIQEGWSYDNLNGGTVGHGLYLVLPEDIYLRSAKNREALQLSIRDGLNNVQNVQNEFIEEVFLEMGLGEEQDWRAESGLTLSSSRVVSDAAQKRIWTDDSFPIILEPQIRI